MEISRDGVSPPRTIFAFMGGFFARVKKNSTNSGFFRVFWKIFPQGGFFNCIGMVIIIGLK